MSVAAFLEGKRFAVVGVSRDRNQAANRVFPKLRGVPHAWFHRSFGQGSVAADAVRECEAQGTGAIVGGCPLMYCEPVDLAHRCMRWWLRKRRRVSA